MANVPANLRYSDDHEWCCINGEYAFVGITDFAQSELGDIVFVDVALLGKLCQGINQIRRHVLSSR